MDIEADDDLANRSIQSSIDGLALVKKKLDEIPVESKAWKLIEDEYMKTRAEILSVFKSIGKSEEELDKLLSDAVAKLKQSGRSGTEPLAT